MSAIDPPSPRAPFLFSVDLEDVRAMIPHGMKYDDAVPRLVDLYLGFLECHKMKCTFFTVGDIARRYPKLVRDIAAEGHELACHSSEHVPISRQSRIEFCDDIRRNIDDLRTAAGGGEIRGFRAPTLSMTPATPWAYEVLAEAGIEYSSSVLAAPSPLFGWPGFSREPVWIEPGLWELPISLTGLPILDIPFASGVYLRVLPLFLQRFLYRRERRQGRPVVMYCHPYDLDTEQEQFWHPEIDGQHFYNWLMYRGRATVLPKLEKMLGEGGEIVRYLDYVADLPKDRTPTPIDGVGNRLA